MRLLLAQPLYFAGLIAEWTVLKYCERVRCCSHPVLTGRSSLLSFTNERISPIIPQQNSRTPFLHHIHNVPVYSSSTTPTTTAATTLVKPTSSLHFLERWNFLVPRSFSPYPTNLHPPTSSTTTSNITTNPYWHEHSQLLIHGPCGNRIYSWRLFANLRVGESTS